MKDPTQPSAAQANLQSDIAPATPPTPTLLQKNLSGTWQCSEPKDASVPCFGQSIIFSDSLDKMSENTFITLDNSQGKCHVAIDYSLSVATDKSGNVALNLGSATLGSLVKDPSNAVECEADFQDSDIPNLTRHQLLSHSDDWKQITLGGVTYSRPDDSKTSQAETWPSP